MLIIHPKDRTTAMLSALYEGREARCFDQSASSRDIARLLHHCPPGERIMLLGHGSEMGLFSRDDDPEADFDRIIVGHQHAYHLRRHKGNIVGIWCHADKFARREGLHGLFSGMIISDKLEAEEYGIITLQHIIDEWNDVMFARLRSLLDDECPLHEIPSRLAAMDDVHSWITSFNYNSFFYL